VNSSFTLAKISACFTESIPKSASRSASSSNNSNGYPVFSLIYPFTLSLICSAFSSLTDVAFSTSASESAVFMSATICEIVRGFSLLSNSESLIVNSSFTLAKISACFTESIPKSASRSASSSNNSNGYPVFSLIYPFTLSLICSAFPNLISNSSFFLELEFSYSGTLFKISASKLVYCD